MLQWWPAYGVGWNKKNNHIKPITTKRRVGKTVARVGREVFRDWDPRHLLSIFLLVSIFLFMACDKIRAKKNESLTPSSPPQVTQGSCAAQGEVLNADGSACVAKPADPGPSQTKPPETREPVNQPETKTPEVKPPIIINPAINRLTSSCIYNDAKDQIHMHICVEGVNLNQNLFDRMKAQCQKDKGFLEGRIEVTFAEAACPGLMGSFPKLSGCQLDKADHTEIHWSYVGKLPCHGTAVRPE